MRKQFCRFVYWLIEPLLDRIDQRRRIQMINAAEPSDVTLGFRTDQSSEAEHHYP